MEEQGRRDFSGGEIQAEYEILPLGRAIADDLIASVEIPECSVAASDTAEEAENVFNSTKKHRPKNLLLSDNEFLPQEVSLKWMSSDIELGTGHTVRLALGLPDKSISNLNASDEHEPAPRLTLFAVARRNIAFPLARFGRNNQVFCDHVQFWGEEDGDELDSKNIYGWGEDDNGSRFDAVQTLSALLKGNPDARIRLVEQLNLEKRLENKLGPTTPEIEQLISLMFKKRFKNATQTFSQEYSDQLFGRIITDITADGVLSPIKDEPNKRKVTLRTYPSSQANRNWVPREFIADLRSNITTLDGDTSPRTLDIQIMLDLLENAESEIQQEVAPVGGSENKRSFFNTFSPFHGGAFIGASAFQGMNILINDQKFIAEQFFWRSNGLAIISALGMTAVSRIISKRREAIRKHNQAFRDEMEEL